MTSYEKIGIGVIGFIIAAAITGILVFSIFDWGGAKKHDKPDAFQLKTDEDQRDKAMEEHEMAMERLEKAEYEKMRNDVSQGLYSGEELKDAIGEILEHGDDLSGMNLSEANLRKVDLAGVNLNHAHLQKAKLDYANLR